MNIVAELRAAVMAYDDWPTPEKGARVIDLARRLDHRTAVIAHMRQRVTPSEQALSELLNVDI